MTIQEQINQQCVIITNAENFLHDTDYMSIREYEGDAPEPPVEEEEVSHNE